MDPRPIGVFDSGVGGLTVARALLDALPNESIVYVGDTARGPYGPRSRAEVRRFALELAGLLVGEGAKMLVVACNSVSSAGLDEVRAAFPQIPIIEVIEPAVRAAVTATRNGRIGVIGTSLTITSGAYDDAVRATGTPVQLTSAACPRFVEFVESDSDHPEVISTAREYLAPLLADGVDTIILGCTHYPMLLPYLQYVCGPGVVLIESDKEAAIDVFAALTRGDLHRPRGIAPSHRFLCTGDPDAFAAIGMRFLGPAISKVDAIGLEVG